MAAQDYTVHLRKGIKFSMTAVTSETKEDVELYERATYRDNMDAAYLNASQYAWDGAFPPTAGTALDESDIYQHVAPRHEVRKRSRYVWKNAGTDVLGWAWCDEIISISTGAPTRF